MFIRALPVYLFVLRAFRLTKVARMSNTLQGTTSWHITPNHRRRDQFINAKATLNPSKSRITFPALELAAKLFQGVPQPKESVLSFANEHSHTLNDDAKLVKDSEQEGKTEEQSQPECDQWMIANS